MSDYKALENNGGMNSVQNWRNSKVSQLHNRKRKSSLCVCDKEDNVLTGSDMLKGRWKEYTEDSQ